MTKTAVVKVTIFTKGQKTITDSLTLKGFAGK
jgi:hypothetical protein